MRRLLLACLFLGPAASARAGQLPTGDFLNIPVDVRALGMGEAAQAVSAGVSEISMNPAALAAMQAQQFYVTRSFLYAGVSSDYLAYGYTAGSHRLGLTYQHVGYGNLEGRDITGGETGSFGPGDTAYSLAYATSRGPLSLGATVKRVESTIATTARTTAFDVGSQYQLNEEWRLGASLHQLGGKLKFDSVSSPLPVRAAVGAGWRAAEGWWLALDAVHPFYTPSYIAIGSSYAREIKDLGTVALRIGVNTKTPDLGVASGLKAGFGFRLKDLDIDYAFNTAGTLGDTHNLGLGYRFGKGKESSAR